MRTFLSTIAAATLFAGAAVASESWTEIPTASGPLMTGTLVADAGGDSAPIYAAGTSPHVSAEVNGIVVAGGDSYDVIPFAFMGRSSPAPTAVAAAQRQPGGG